MVDFRLQPYFTQLQELASEHRLRALRNITVRSARTVECDGRLCLNFSSNNYLGLSTHPLLLSRAAQYLQSFGAGSGASQLLSGNGALHKAIEQKIAAHKQSEAALLFPSGFQANTTILATLLDARVLGSKPLVYSDRLNHASMHAGCALAQVREHRYLHNDLNSLETLLKSHSSEVHKGTRFILTESVFSMDGDLADVPGLVFLAKKYDAMLYVDEAHATGIMGKQGYGLAQGLGEEIPWLAMGTFSKALGSSGAYLACPQILRDFLLNRAPGFIFTTALPPPVLGAIDAALDLLPELDAERNHLFSLAARVRAKLREWGQVCPDAKTPIIPIILGEDLKAIRAFSRLIEKNILAMPIRPPTVPLGKARLRLSLTSAHTHEDIDKLLEALQATLGELCH